MRKIVIIGAGFAGLSALKVLTPSKLIDKVIVIESKISADFLPLLPDIIGQRINSQSASVAIDNFAKSKKCELIKDSVVGIDVAQKQVKTTNKTMDYDYLIIASGAKTNFYNNKNMEDNAFKLYSVEDALKLLKQLRNNQYENYVVVGGGYTGVETATNLWRFLRKNKQEGKIYIVEKAPKLLGLLPDSLRDYAISNLNSLNIEMLVNVGIKEISDKKVTLDNGELLDNAIVIWSAGVKTADFIDAMKVDKTNQGRIKVNEFLQLNENCYVVGDAASFEYKKEFLRMAVMFALNEGKCAAQNIIRSITGQALKEYVPKDLGYIVPMANGKGCGKVLGKELFGFIPSFLHYFMCIYRSQSLKNQFRLMKEVISGNA